MTTRTSRPPDLSEEEVQLLERRAERLRLPPPQAEDDAVHWIAEFEAGGLIWAFPLASLRGVIPLRAVTPVPLAPAEVVGVVRFQGRIITAYSLASVLGVGWRQDSTVLVIAETRGGGLVAFDCEQVPRAARVPLLSVEQGRASKDGLSREVVTSDMRLLHLLELDALLVRSGKKRSAHAD